MTHSVGTLPVDFYGKCMKITKECSNFSIQQAVLKLFHIGGTTVNPPAMAHFPHDVESRQSKCAKRR